MASSPVLGHLGPLHATSSALGPLQGAERDWQFLERTWTPDWPQSAEHAFQSDHGPQLSRTFSLLSVGRVQMTVQAIPSQESLIFFTCITRTFCLKFEVKESEEWFQLSGKVLLCLRPMPWFLHEWHFSSFKGTVLSKHIFSLLAVVTFRDRTFGTEETDCVVGTVAFRTLLLVEAPEAHGWVRVDRLPSFTGWHPVSGSGFDCPGSLTHSGPVIEANGLQLLIVSAASGVIDIEPRGPLIVV